MCLSKDCVDTELIVLGKNLYCISVFMRSLRLTNGQSPSSIDHVYAILTNIYLYIYIYIYIYMCVCVCVCV